LFVRDHDEGHVVLGYQAEEDINDLDANCGVETESLIAFMIPSSTCSMGPDWNEREEPKADSAAATALVET
jgi:hypothetical protein